MSKIREIIRRTKSIDRQAALFLARKLPLLSQRNIIYTENKWPILSISGWFKFYETSHGEYFLDQLSESIDDKFGEGGWRDIEEVGLK